MFHLGWFTNYMPPAWNKPWAGNAGRSWANGDFYLDMARQLDRAGFDFVMLEDSTALSDTFGGTFEAELRQLVRAPKHDPVPLVPLLAHVTRGLGVVATCSTSFYPPYLLARTMSTLDHLTNGRAGWNIVTSAGSAAAQNFGMDDLPPHDERYAVAEEFASLVEQLWDSWEPDALLVDHDTDTYIDHTKVHRVDFQGAYFASRGPLNTLPGPQGRPVMLQAGGSPVGRAFAARHADAVVAIPKGVEAMKAYRADLTRLATEAGRDPSTLKVFFIVSPIVAETHEEALARRDRLYGLESERLAKRLLLMSGGEIDFSRFPLDEPLPEIAVEHTHGSRSILQTFLDRSRGKTLREAAVADQTESLELVGTPEAVAAQMAEVMAEVGGDGYLIYSGSGQLTRRYVTEICDGLVPELQRRGHVRDHYSAPHLRDNLLAF
ncbi:NtaA/DmoA family FMN-dependent monooxygenase [Pseudonocardia sp. WMMC193]|uniref:NtaA/DmoA family FMN-dependent monooxygenase n=1 Tax=Pseudonocardia sp. WMMC193 TaxID=2911965 RepID=UPI001EEF70F1|nr:NtaA/DmoA family FMN-dependent monooxygenase [Pseudonocardia sp. WMMC193]MCF7548400.1 NtaA/DmoA family FMN-dependent monooxygenase [Pseudonocardia sp. WMMC193]